MKMYIKKISYASKICFSSAKTLLVFPGQSVQKIGMHLPYIQNSEHNAILDNFDKALDYPVDY